MLSRQAVWYLESKVLMPSRSAAPEASLFKRCRAAKPDIPRLKRDGLWHTLTVSGYPAGPVSYNPSQITHVMHVYIGITLLRPMM